MKEVKQNDNTNMNHPAQLTKQQALEYGYEYCVLPDNGYQALTAIEDVEDEDLEIGNYVLVEKEGQSPSFPDEETLIDDIAEQVSCQHGDDTGDDTDDVYNTIKSLDKSLLTPFVEAATKALSGKKYYAATKIVLQGH